MPPGDPQGELDELANLIADYPDGIAISALLEMLGAQVQGRTLQGRLAALVLQFHQLPAAHPA